MKEKVRKKDFSQHPPQAKGEHLLWDNYDNGIFYDALKPKDLEKFAEKAGLSNGCDIKALRPHWISAKSILEVGAGHGRVINALLNNDYTGKISAIERCPCMCNHLRKLYDSKIQLLKSDIHNLNNLTEKFDVILWLWSGIADFSKEEQPLIVKALSNLLQKDGKLIIDTIAMNLLPLEATKLGEQSYSMTVNDFIKYIYEPNPQEITDYAKAAGFSNVDFIRCQTDNDRERWLYVLS